MARKERPDFASDPFQLMPELDKALRSKAHEYSESRTLHQLYYQRPEYSPETLVGSIISFTGLKKLGFSVVGEAFDSAVNRTAKEIRTRLVTEGGTSSQRAAVGAANRIIEGLQRTQTRRVGKPMLYDAGLSAEGYGYALRYVDAEGNLALDRLNPFYTHVSADGMKGMTRRFLSRRTAVALHGHTEEFIEAINRKDAEYPEPIPGVDSSTSYDCDDTIAVDYGWVVPAGKKQPGKFVVQLDANTILEEGEWKHPRLPILRLKLADGFQNGSGRPVGRSLAPYQYWTNNLLQKLYVQIQAQVPHIVEEEGTNTKAPSDLPFQRWTVKKGKKAPEITIPKTVSSEVIAHLDRLHNGAMREIGSTDGSSEVIPPGIKSGLWGYGIDSYNDYRRTGFPVLHDGNTDNLAVTTRTRSFPLSFPHELQDLITNPNAPPQRVISTDRVFWDPN
jgi:hypothetical protein